MLSPVENSLSALILLNRCPVVVHGLQMAAQI